MLTHNIGERLLVNDEEGQLVGISATGPPGQGSWRGGPTDQRLSAIHDGQTRERLLPPIRSPVPWARWTAALSSTPRPSTKPADHVISVRDVLLTSPHVATAEAFGNLTHFTGFPVTQDTASIRRGRVPSQSGSRNAGR